MLRTTWGWANTGLPWQHKTAMLTNVVNENRRLTEIMRGLDFTYILVLPSRGVGRFVTVLTANKPAWENQRILAQFSVT
jgi:hypothetical protein